MRKLIRNRPTIGVLAGWHAYSGTIHSFLDYVFRGIQAAANTYECNLMIGCGVNAAPFTNLKHTALPVLLPDTEFVPVGPWNTDGLIVAAPVFNTRAMNYFEDLISQGFPIVFAGDRNFGPSVIVDNESGIHQAVDHLIEHGHRRIAFISGHPRHDGDTAARMQAYISGIERHGIAFDPNLTAIGEHTVSTSYQAMNEILGRNKPFTAVIASNDESAVGAMDALRDAGLSVPQDVAVIGFDDRIEAWAQIPLLTTVHHPKFELGYQSFELLHRIISGTAQPDALVSIPTHLIIRESCGCLPGTGSGAKQPDLAAALSASLTFPINPTQLRSGGITAPVTLTAPTLVSSPINSAISSATSPRTSPKSTEEDRNHLIVQMMTEAVYKEMQRLNRREVEYLCYRLLDAFKLSLIHGNATTFRQAVQQILEHIVKVGDDLYAWQGAISVIKNIAPALLDSLPYTLPQEQIENMLHQARIAISEVSRGQYSRRLVHQTNVANHIGQMTSHFFAAQTEDEIYDIFSKNLSNLGILKAAVAIYEAEAQGDPSQIDPEDESANYAWSVLKMPSDMPDMPKRFATRQFPPPELFPTDQVFQLAVLPLCGAEGIIGFAAFAATDMEPLGSIANQLVAAVRSVQFHQEAVAAQKMAEEARQSAEEARKGAEDARKGAEDARKGAEDARKMAEEARQEAEEANYLKSRFLSIVSHELRTPLNLIYGLSNMILEQSRQINDQECAVNRKDLERIDIGAQHLESLIRDVLDLARSDLGQLKLVYEPLDAQDVLDAVAVIGEKLTHDKGLEWIIDVPDCLPRIRGDRTRLRQVILNLVNNAIKFTEQGSVTLAAHLVNNQVVISVRDTGLGIPVDEQCLIFDEFRQSRRTTARGFGGLGLGLAICKRLVELHGGEIGVTSSGEEGSGSTFFIHLPPIEILTPVAASSSTEGRTERVLLLIQDLAGGETLNQHLTQKGFEVEVHSLELGCEWMKWLVPNLPDKIVLDLRLTSEHGWEILKTLKENPATRSIPVLFYKLEDDQDSGALLDLNFLTKPISTSELADELLTRGLIDGKNNRGAGRTILVVDDDPGILELHTRILGPMAGGYRILQARNGREALAIIEKEIPVLVLLDLIMPEMDGFTVLERMQANEQTRSIPVIVLTSQVLTEEDMMRLNYGVAGVLSKGMYNTQETLEHVSAALARKRRPGTETQRMVLKAIAYIHAHYQDPMSRSDVAGYVGVSERHLARCFQQEIGMTPIIYLNRFRVNIAKSLLSSGKMSITDVALEVGFSAGGYFTRVFRDETGISPREYMRNC